MKDYSREEYEKTRPNVGPVEAITFCLRQLYADEKHVAEDEVAGVCTYEELIGALLVAKDEIDRLESEMSESNEV